MSPAGTSSAGSPSPSPSSVAHTVRAAAIAASDAAMASSTATWASSTACCRAASWGSLLVVVGAWLIDASTTSDDVDVADAGWTVGASSLDSPSNARLRASSACASDSFFWLSARVSCAVSNDPSAWPSDTSSPAATSTVATVPLAGNATAAWDTGSMVATEESSASTERTSARAVRNPWPCEPPATDEAMSPTTVTSPTIVAAMVQRRRRDVDAGWLNTRSTRSSMSFPWWWSLSFCAFI